VNSFDFSNPPGLFIEIGPASWQVLNGDAFMEFPLERQDDGRMTDSGRERLVAGLRSFLHKEGWRPRRRAFVAIGARGVALRRLTLPPAPAEEFQRLLRLQIEGEFPLPPDDLAWGWQMLGQKSGRQEVLVAAVKKEVIAASSQILGECGVSPFFTLAALARNTVWPPPLPSCAVLHIGAGESELLLFQDGAPASIRLLPWGGQSGTPIPPGCLDPKSIGGQLYLTGRDARLPAVAARLAQCPGMASPCPVLEPAGGNGRSAAIAGLKKLAVNRSGAPPLIIQSSESADAAAGVTAWKWAAAAVLLLLALITFPWVEAIVLKPHLSRKLTAIEADRPRLAAIDHELEFLQFLKRSQPPYLDTMYLIAKVAPPGTSFESVAMSRRGDLSLRGKMADAGQVTEFRSNLIHSAWFSSVVVEEQTPTPDRQVSVRMSAQLKPVDARKPLVVDLPAPKPEPAAHSDKESKPPAGPAEPPAPAKK
jgi:hypothetical protein